MGKFSGMFRSSATKDNAEGLQIPPPPYSGPEGNDPITEDKKQPTDRPNGQSSTMQSDNPPPADPVPAVPDVLITFKVGPEAKEFKFSKARFCAESQLYREYFRSGKPEAEVTTFTCSDHPPRCFEIISHWFDTGKLPDHWHEGHRPGTQSAVENIGVLYKSLNRMQLRYMANDVIDATRALFADRTWTVRPFELNYVRSIKLEKTYLFQFYLSLLVFHIHTIPKYMLVDDANMVADFEKMWDDKDLTKVIMKHVLKWQLEKWGDPRTPPGCYYHNHTDGCKSWDKKKD